MRGAIGSVMVVVVCLGCGQKQNAPRQEAGMTDATIKPFLCLPFSEGTKFTITEGWYYSDQEKAIHGYETHYAVDFATDRGTPVVAAADGLALASFHSAWAKKEHQGKKVGFGLGRFVQIWHPEAKLYTMYAHLEKIADGIPYVVPIKQGEMWNPTVVNQTVDKVIAQCKPVKKGQVIGYVGDTGLAWGYEETPTMRPDPKQFFSWDETHLHFEVYDRDDRGIKKNRYDPFGVYGKADAYTALYKGGLWLLTKNNQPRFAK